MTFANINSMSRWQPARGHGGVGYQPENPFNTYRTQARNDWLRNNAGQTAWAGIR
jgi:hypothetical protein